MTHLSTLVTFFLCLSSRTRRFGGDGQRFGDREGYRGGPGGYGGAPGAEGKEGAPGVYRPSFREVCMPGNVVGYLLVEDVL